MANNQAVGGIGAAALGGGVANVLGGVVHVSGSTLAHNRAQGGDGGERPRRRHLQRAGLHPPVEPRRPDGPHGRGECHHPQQGPGGRRRGRRAPATAWAAASGTAAPHPSVDTAISHNRALGGDGADGGGGNGFGGGAYNAAAASLRLERSTVTKNHANGGEGDAGDGEGIGGGVYNLGRFDFDVLTLIFENHASTSHDDVFSL